MQEAAGLPIIETKVRACFSMVGVPVSFSVSARLSQVQEQGSRPSPRVGREGQMSNSTR